MPDREKVVGHLYDCLTSSKPENAWIFVRKDIVGDALALLREKEPLPGTWLPDRPGHYKCSACGAQWGQAARAMKHCPDCGRRMEV